jgi:hypothetical protein
MGRPLGAEAGQLTCMVAGSCTKADILLQHLATDLKGTVIILPRAVPKVSAAAWSSEGCEQMARAILLDELSN